MTSVDIIAGIAVAVIIGGVSYFDRRAKHRAARFDSETGKQIDDE